MGIIDISSHSLHGCSWNAGSEIVPDLGQAHTSIKRSEMIPGATGTPKRLSIAPLHFSR